MSTLEKLPIEVLQRIFILSLSPNLPRASPIIGGSLSSKHVYLEALFAAFEETWEERCLAIRDTDFKALKWKKKLTTGNPEAQVRSLRYFISRSITNVLKSALLRCRWASLDILRWAEEQYLRQRAVRDNHRVNAPFTITSPC
jgi:hypothetical protein